MRIVIDRSHEVTRPDPIVEAGSLATRVKLSPNVQHVKAGTPLRPSTLGWEPAPDGLHTVVFASAAGYGGSEVRVCRELVIDLPTIRLVPGARYTVGDIEPSGYTNFKPDDAGPYTALTDRTILLTPEV